MATLATAVGGVIAAGYVGDFGALARLLICTLVFFLAFFGFYHGVRHRKTLHIDISDAGRIRVAEVVSITSCVDEDRPHFKTDTIIVGIMDNSTIWPNLLMLSLRMDDERITVLPIVQDSVSREAFRALSVACRWIAARSDRREKTIFETHSK